MSTMLLLITSTYRNLLDTSNSHYSNTKILSPFFIKGKGRTKAPPLDLICTILSMLPMSTCWIFRKSFKWRTWIYNSTEYDTPITKDSYLHQSPNQVGIHIWLNHPANWDYNFYTTTQPSGIAYLTWPQNSIHGWIWQLLHDRSPYDIYIKWYIWH